MTQLSLFGSQNGRVLYNRTSLAAILLLGLVSCFSAGAITTTENADGADAKATAEIADGADAKATAEIMTVTLLGAAYWHFPVVALYQSSSSREWKQKRWARDDTELTFNLSGGEDIKLLVFYTTNAKKLEPFLFSSTKLYEKRISGDTEGQNIELERFQDHSKPPQITLVEERLRKPTDGSHGQIVVTVENRDGTVIPDATVEVEIDNQNNVLIDDYSSDTDAIGQAKIGIHQTPFQSCRLGTVMCDHYYNIRVTCSIPNYEKEAFSKKVTYPKDIDRRVQIPQYRATCTMNTPKKPSLMRFKIKEAEGDKLPIENAQVKVTTQKPKQEDYADTNKEGIAIIPLHKFTRQTRIRVEKEGFNRFAGTLQKISGLHTDFLEVPPIKLSLPVDKFLLSLQLVDSNDKTPINLSTLDNVSVEREEGNKPIPRNQIELNNSGGYITLPYFSLLTKQERNEQIKIIVTEPDYNTEEVTISLKDSAWKSTGTRQWFRELQIPLRQKGTGLLVIINPANNWSRYNLTRHIVRTQLGNLLNSSPSTYSQVGIGVLGEEMEMLIGSTTEPVETRRSILHQLRRSRAIYGKTRPEKIVELLKKHEDKLYSASQWRIVIVIPHDPFADSPEDTTLNRMTELLIKHNVELSIIEDGEPNGSDFYKKLAQWQQGQKQQYFKHLPVDSEEGLQQQITSLIVAE
jgi:hypothetical protein